MSLEDFKGKKGFNKTRNEKYIDENEKLVARYRRAFLEAQKYNTGTVIPSQTNNFSVEEMILRDINSNLF